VRTHTHKTHTHTHTFSLLRRSDHPTAEAATCTTQQTQEMNIPTLSWI